MSEMSSDVSVVVRLNIGQVGFFSVSLFSGTCCRSLSTSLKDPLFNRLNDPEKGFKDLVDPAPGRLNLARETINVEGQPYFTKMAQALGDRDAFRILTLLAFHEDDPLDARFAFKGIHSPESILHPFFEGIHESLLNEWLLTHKSPADWKAHRESDNKRVIREYLQAHAHLHQGMEHGQITAPNIWHEMRLSVIQESALEIDRRVKSMRPSAERTCIQQLFQALWPLAALESWRKRLADEHEVVHNELNRRSPPKWYAPPNGEERAKYNGLLEDNHSLLGRRYWGFQERQKRELALLAVIEKASKELKHPNFLMPAAHKEIHELEATTRPL